MNGDGGVVQLKRLGAVEAEVSLQILRHQNVSEERDSRAKWSLRKRETELEKSSSRGISAGKAGGLQHV